MSKKPTVHPSSPFDLSGPSIFAADPHFRGASVRRGIRQTFGDTKGPTAWGNGDMGPMSAAGAVRARQRNMTPERLSIGPIPKRLIKPGRKS